MPFLVVRIKKRIGGGDQIVEGPFKGKGYYPSFDPVADPFTHLNDAKKFKDEQDWKEDLIIIEYSEYL